MGGARERARRGGRGGAVRVGGRSGGRPGRRRRPGSGALSHPPHRRALGAARAVDRTGHRCRGLLPRRARERRRHRRRAEPARGRRLGPRGHRRAAAGLPDRDPLGHPAPPARHRDGGRDLGASVRPRRRRLARRAPRRGAPDRPRHRRRRSHRRGRRGRRPDRGQPGAVHDDRRLRGPPARRAGGHGWGRGARTRHRRRRRLGARPHRDHARRRRRHAAPRACHGADRPGRHPGPAGADLLDPREPRPARAARAVRAQSRERLPSRSLPADQPGPAVRASGRAGRRGRAQCRGVPGRRGHRAGMSRAAAIMPTAEIERISAVHDRPFGFLVVLPDTGVVAFAGWVADPSS